MIRRDQRLSIIALIIEKIIREMLKLLTVDARPPTIPSLT
jgi:hypothetical protein